MAPDVLGRPVEEAVKLLSDAGVKYVTELTRPTKHFFSRGRREAICGSGRYLPGRFLPPDIGGEAEKAVKEV